MRCAPLRDYTRPASHAQSATRCADVIAGALDAAYDRSLRTASLLAFPTGRSRAAASLRMVYETVVLSRGQIDIIYGPQKSWRGYLFRRLARPFDLAWRLVRSLAASIAVRSRRPT